MTIFFFFFFPASLKFLENVLCAEVYSELNLFLNDYICFLYVIS